MNYPCVPTYLTAIMLGILCGILLFATEKIIKRLIAALPNSLSKRSEFMLCVVARALLFSPVYFLMQQVLQIPSPLMTQLPVLFIFAISLGITSGTLSVLHPIITSR
jgi:hypothetical protein